MSYIFRHIKNRSLAHVKRFNAIPQHFSESVAEHSFYVSYITMILCDLLHEKGEEVDKDKAVSMALIHDMEEMYSGDILSPFKHYSSEVRDAIRKVNKEVIKEAFVDLPGSLTERYTALWNTEGAQDTREAEIVKMADRLSLLAKCAEEVKAGNAHFNDIYERELQSVKDDRKPWWEKIKHHVFSIVDESS